MLCNSQFHTALLTDHVHYPSTVYTVVPVYIAEIAPKKLRGRLISFISLGLTGGVLVCLISLSQTVSDFWLISSEIIFSLKTLFCINLFTGGGCRQFDMSTVHFWLEDFTFSRNSHRNNSCSWNDFPS